MYGIESRQKEEEITKYIATESRTEFEQIQKLEGKDGQETMKTKTGLISPYT